MQGIEETPQPLSLQTLYQDHRKWLRSWIIKQLGSVTDAEDIVQDTFLRLVLSPDALKKMHQPKAFLATTSRRIIIDRFRRQQLEQAYLEELAQLADEADHHLSPEHLHEVLQALESISRVLDKLPEKNRTAFLLHYLQGYSHAQIAAQLNTTPRMIYKYLTKALILCQDICRES